MIYAQKFKSAVKSLKMSTPDEIRAMVEEIKKLKSENEEYKKRVRPVTFEVSERGAISVFGLGKNPQTLYKIQWERILENSDQLKKFIADNKAHLN